MANKNLSLDLHCHSLCSDGTETPGRVGHMARAAGVRLFCLTDHDTWRGCEDANAALPDATVLRGLELSANHNGRSVHLLLYGLQEGDGLDALERRVKILRQGRRERIVAICERLAVQGIVLDADEILADAGTATAGRPHVARALVRHGHCTSSQEAFFRYLGDDGPATVPAPHLPVPEALGLALDAGARVSLAHPHVLGGPDKVGPLCQEWKPLGLQGIEAHYGPYSSRQRRHWLGVARDLGLVVTAGSDFHGVAALADVKCPGTTLPMDLARPLCEWLGVDLGL